MSSDNAEAYVGHRFEDLDSRNSGRVIEVKSDLGGGYFLAETEAHPKNPDAVGNRSRISGYSLSRRFRKISR